MPEEKKKLTIADVAKEAEVSISTVSAVLNRRSDISAETSQAVMRVMQEMGFKPRPNRKRRHRMDFRDSRLRSVAFLIPDVNEEAMFTELSIGLMQGIEHVLFEHEVSLIITRLRGQGAMPPCLVRHEAQAVIVRGGQIDEETRAGLAGLPVVWLFELGQPPAHADRVGTENEGTGRAAIEALHKRGVKRVLSLNPLDSQRNPHPVSEVRNAGARLAATELGMDFHSVYVEDSKLNRLAFSEDLLRDRHITDRPDAVFLANTTDFGLVDQTTGKLSQVGHARLQSQKLGELAAEQAIWRFKHPGTQARRLVIDPSITYLDKGGNQKE